MLTYFQIANHLDRAVSSLGRDPLKVLVQVNTSGEECEYREKKNENLENPYLEDLWNLISCLA